MKIESLTRCKRLAATAAFLVILCSDPAAAQADAAEANGVWRDQAHGMTLALPAGCQAQKEIPPGTVVRIVSTKGEEDFAVTVSLRIYGELVDIPELLDKSLWQVIEAKLFAQEVMDQRIMRVGEYEAGVAYYLLADIRRTAREELKRTAATPNRLPDKRWVMGQAFLQVGYYTVIVFQLDVGEERFDEVKPIFESLYKGLRIDSDQLDQRREKLLLAFTDWRKTLTTEHLHAAVVKDQWRRVTDDGKDVGYMRVRQRRLNKLNMPGLQVSIETHITDMKRAADSKSDFFLSDDSRTEIWSIRMTARPLHPKKRKAPKDLHLALGKHDGNTVMLPGKTVTLSGVELEPDATSWVETGLREGDVITVSRQSEAGVKEYRWIPPAPYLSMVELYLLGQLGQSLPWDNMGFYAYFPSIGKLTFHTAKLERSNDKTYRVLFKPTPNSPQRITHYDAAGVFKSNTLPAGRLVQQTKRSVIEAKWRKP